MKRIYNSDDNDNFYITQVNKIIKMLPDETFNKIPNSIVHFLDENSDKNLENTMQLTPDMVNQSLPQDTLKYLKVINYYINDKKLY
ncbi:unknown [Clostridium sp. CAG:921]|nr:unknown [Clostridium sp. CAG:921]